MDQQQQQQQQMLLQQQQQAQHQQQQQAQHQQQFLLLQQLQKQAQQHQQSSAISRFPSNIDAHLRPPGFHRALNLQQPNTNPNPNPNPKLNSNPNSGLQQQQPSNSAQNAQQLQQNKGIRPPVNQIELQMAYQDAWRVCHPDVKRPFSSLEDACERLLPYHVVADYEAEEDDRILDSDTTGQMPSRTQQWDHNIASKVAEFTATFEKQALAFNIITRKRALGEFRSEERLMAEQILLQEEKRLLLEAKAEIDAREKAQLRMAAMAQEEKARAESHPIRGSALGSQSHDMGEPEHDQMMNMNGWGNNGQKDDKELSEDFLNDEETDNGDTSEWREVGEFDLNTR